MNVEAGMQIDRYIVEQFIGKGGMAEVFKVRHAQLDTQHALKLLTTPSENVRMRLLQEGKAQAKLRHPNIVNVTDVIAFEGAPGLVMEYIEGPPLDVLLKAKHLTVYQADSIARGIIEGVLAAHSHGLIHRDLKPSNIMLKITKGGLVPKVADFGLVKVVQGDGATSHTMTQTGMALGTPAYMSPEQIRNTRDVDSRADIFSLGAILYELVCHRRAFEGEDLMDLFMTVVYGQFVKPAELVPDLPDRMNETILGALKVDKDERIADCDSLLSQWVGGAV